MKNIRFIYFILAFFSILYSVTIYMTGSGTFSFVIWIVSALFFCFLYLMEKKKLWQLVPSAVRFAFSSLVFLFMIIFLICQGCILSKFFSNGKPGADYIIVLGAQMREWGPSVVYKARLDSAIKYLKENPDTKVVVTGGKGSNESISEGDGGKDYLLQQGILENRIIVENKSLDTDENIKNALSLIEITDTMTIGVVTNNFHVFRGVLIAKRYTDAEVMGIAAFTEYLYLPNNMVRETFGILKDF